MNVSSLSSAIQQQVQQILQQALSQAQPSGGPTASPSGSPSAPAPAAPQDSFEAAPGGSSQPAGNANPDAVAQQIASDAAGWNYDHSGGKTWDQTLANEGNFDQSKSGVCADMALEAAQRFEEAGVESRVQFGETDRGNHAWVEYKDANGEWQKFDPTAAASTGNAADAITPMDNGLYGYGSAFSTYDAPAEGSLA